MATLSEHNLDWIKYFLDQDWIKYFFSTPGPVSQKLKCGLLSDQMTRPLEDDPVNAGIHQQDFWCMRGGTGESKGNQKLKFPVKKKGLKTVPKVSHAPMGQWKGARGQVQDFYISDRKVWTHSESGANLINLNRL